MLRRIWYTSIPVYRYIGIIGNHLPNNRGFLFLNCDDIFHRCLRSRQATLKYVVMVMGKHLQIYLLSAFSIFKEKPGKATDYFEHFKSLAHLTRVAVELLKVFSAFVTDTNQTFYTGHWTAF